MSCLCSEATVQLSQLASLSHNPHLLLSSSRYILKLIEEQFNIIVAIYVSGRDSTQQQKSRYLL